MSKELKTLKDLKRKFGDFDSITRTLDSEFVDYEILRQEAIRWIKKDIEDSVDESVNTDKDWKEFKERWGSKLPDGRYCDCDPEMSCEFHREGKRMMGFFNITEGELK